MPSTLSRRAVLKDGVLLGAGLLTGALGPRLYTALVDQPAAAQGQAGRISFEQRLKDLKIELPPPSKPVAVYVPAVVTGNLLYTAGHIPWLPDGTLRQGRVGADLTVEEGAEAARLVGLHILTTVRQTLKTLDRVSRLVKVLGMVNCTDDFTQQPKVINGFSELMVQVFGDEAGKGGRSAIGVNTLPSNVPVEVEAVFEILAG